MTQTRTSPHVWATGPAVPQEQSAQKHACGHSVGKYLKLLALPHSGSHFPEPAVLSQRCCTVQTSLLLKSQPPPSHPNDTGCFLSLQSTAQPLQQQNATCFLVVAGRWLHLTGDPPPARSATARLGLLIRQVAGSGLPTLGLSLLSYVATVFKRASGRERRCQGSTL